MAENKDYVIPSGRVYFNAFVPGTKTPTTRRYLGNTPGFSLNQSEETIDHYDADDGSRQKDDQFTLSSDAAGTMVTDNINVENTALWWKGSSTQTIVAAASDKTFAIADAVLGAYYQLGKDADSPFGDQNITGLAITKGVTPVTLDTNFVYDLATGMIQIRADAPDVDAGDDLTATYDIEGHTETIIIAGAVPLYGELYFEATNTKGPKKDYLIPYAKLGPDGDLELKGDDWQEYNFTVEVLKLNSATPRVYVRDRPAG